MTKDIDDFITTGEAAQISGYSSDYIGTLCRGGILSGVRRKGNIWLVPKKSVEDYEPGLQGFAAVQARKRAEEAARQAEVNGVIRAAHGMLEPQSGQEPAQAPTEYISVEEAAKRLNRPLRAIRSWCLWGWFVDALKSDKKGKEWRIPVGSLDGALKHVRVYNSAKIKALQAAESHNDAEKAGD